MTNIVQGGRLAETQVFLGGRVSWPGRAADGGAH
jgi:hypothetical protein